MPKTKQRWLCERLMQKTVAVLTRVAEGHGLTVPPKLTKTKLTWLVAGAMLDAPDAPGPKKKPKMLWYVLRTVPGKEKRIRRELMRQVKIQYLSKLVGRILIPRRKSVELKGGERVVFRRKSFRGYLLCRVVFNPETFHLFDKCEFSFGFAPNRFRPTPIDEEFMARLLKDHKDSEERKLDPVQTNVRPGDRILIAGGAFDGYEAVAVKVTGDGTADPVVKAEIKILGRPVVVELKSHQFQKLES